MYVRGDRIMAGICCVLCVISACFAPAYGTWGLCVFGAAPLAGLAVALAWKFAGRLFTRLVIAFIFMSFAALYIDQFRGLIEMHFSVFVLLAFLLFYRDWRPVALAAGVIAVQHYGFCMLQMRGFPLYVFPMDHGCSMVLVHAAFVIFESACLIYLGAVTRKEAIESAIITALGELMARDGVVDLGMMHGAGRSRGLQQFLQAIRSTVEGAGMAADRIGSVSLEITGSAKRMFEAGSTQNSATSEVVTTLHRMAEATGSIATDCNEVARVVTTSKDILHSGRNTMAQTVTLMETLELSVADVSRQINDLHGDSARIETIIRSISDIADQTTLLAFNATIEATRAGELGSGFNVVAREVRDLSTRTLASLSEAQQVVEQVRSRTASAKLASDRCRQDATRGGAQVGQAHLALAGVAERLPDIAARTADVLRVAERHGQLAGKIMERLDDIGAAVGTNSEDLSRFDELSRGLHEMARELCTSVSQFRAA